MHERGEAQIQKCTQIQAEKQGGTRILGTSEPSQPLSGGGGVQDAAVLGQSASGEAEDVGIKGQISGVAAEAQSMKASSSWNPRASCVELSPVRGLGQCGELEAGGGPLH